MSVELGNKPEAAVSSPVTLTNNGVNENKQPDGTNTTGGGPQRANKPKPLKLLASTTTASVDGGTGGGGGKTIYLPRNPPLQSNALPQQQSNQPITIEEVLDLMETINNAVKASQFNSQLATHIFRLCHQLKISGECMEQSHKNELNRTFVSLRQACCRDAGQLGTPCRLKIMELVELRAMGWRPSLAHSQYYLNRTTTQPAVTAHEYHQLPVSQQAPPPPLSTLRYTVLHQQQPQPPSHHPTTEPQPLVAGPAPVSAPPFGAIPMNPFGAFGAAPPTSLFHHIPTTMEQLTTSHPGPGLPGHHVGPHSYYLIPAGGAFLPHTMMPPPASPLNPPLAQQFFPQAASVGVTATGTAAVDDTANWPKGAVTRPSPKFVRPQKVPGKNQFRDEILIRNADSGKIMGVKGRRVAVVEEISKTVISFQKVVAGSKERTLTITGNDEVSIEHAKKLIDETIRRNVSPNRPEGMIVEESGAETIDGAALSGGESNDDGDDNLGISIETAQDGSLKLKCADAKVLAAAQEALSEYLSKAGVTRRTQTGMTAEEREQRQQRRKSMPSFSPDRSAKDGKRENVRTVSTSDKKAKTGGSEKKAERSEGADSLNWRSIAKSTPDLSGGATPRLSVQLQYSREFMLRCAESPLATLPPVWPATAHPDHADILKQPATETAAVETQ